MGSLIRRNIVYIAAFFTVVFWASAFPAVKYSLRFYSPESVMLLRFIVASIVLGTYCIIKKIPVPDKKDMPMIAFSGFIGIFIYMWAFNSGTNLVTSGLSSFIIASAPIFTVLLSIYFLKEKTSVLSWVGLTISFMGLVLVASTQVTGLSINFGVVLLLVSVLCTSFYFILQRKLSRKYSAIQATSYVIFFATFFMFIFTPKLIAEMPHSTAFVNLVVVYMGVFPAALSYFLWGFALSKAENTAQVTSFLYLSPFIATALSILLLGEHIEPLVIIGGVIIIAGLLVTNIKKK